MPTDIFCAQISIPPKKRNADPIKETVCKDPLRRKSKMAQYWICHLQSFNSWCSSAVCGWGHGAQSRTWVGCGCISKEHSFFCVLAPVFPLKLGGPKLDSVRIEWSSCWVFCYSMRWIYHTHKLQPCWLFDEKTGQGIEQMQLSEIAEIVPWSCHKIKLILFFKKKALKLQTIFLHLFSLDPHQNIAAVKNQP